MKAMKLTMLAVLLGLICYSPNCFAMRGVMVSPQVTVNDLIDLAGWKANLIRYQLNWYWGITADSANLQEYEAWLEGELNRLDSLLPTCEQYGLKVVIDLHTPPGGRILSGNKKDEYRIFHESWAQKAFISIWEKISQRYKGNKNIWGYDLVNEPHVWNPSTGLMGWSELAQVTSQKIRIIDTQTTIIIEPPWGTNPLLLSRLTPVKNISNVIYSFHMYGPGEFTHQGIDGRPSGIYYPGKINGVYYDKNKLKSFLQPVIDYQRKYNVRFYIGEFSAVRWDVRKNKLYI